MLSDFDYPWSFRGKLPHSKRFAHPDDYKIDKQAIKPQFFLYKGEKGRNRMFIRTSFLLHEKTEKEDAKFTAATFLLDSGCCPHFNMCEELHSMLQHRIVKDSAPFDYIKIHIGGKDHDCEVCRDLPDIHEPANVIGLPMFFSLGMQFQATHINKLTTDVERVVSHVVVTEPFSYF
jgi:hypothetical protein